ncbi:DUF169 domain-containing protein [Spirochaetota bacterium]
MSKNKDYAKKLKDLEGYERGILAFKLSDEEPEGMDSYGDDESFLCAITAEAWDRDKPFYITAHNVICGGQIYAGIGPKKIEKDEYDAGMSMALGKNKAYENREIMRRVNQQCPHYFKMHKYMIIGLLDQIEDPDMIMIVTDANRVMRLTKAYAWKTGELTHGVSGTAWCSECFPHVGRTKSMTFNMGDPPARMFMGLEPGEMYCTIDYKFLPIVVDNLENISSGQVEF